jgi:hypothetical protein
VIALHDLLVLHDRFVVLFLVDELRGSLKYFLAIYGHVLSLEPGRRRYQHQTARVGSRVFLVNETDWPRCFTLPLDQNGLTTAK